MGWSLIAGGALPDQLNTAMSASGPKPTLARIASNDRSQPKADMVQAPQPLYFSEEHRTEKSNPEGGMYSIPYLA